MIDPHSQQVEALQVAFVTLARHLDNAGKLSSSALAHDLEQAATSRDVFGTRLLQALAIALRDDGSLSERDVKAGRELPLPLRSTLREG